MGEVRAKPIGPFEVGDRGATVMLERCDEAYAIAARSISAAIRYDPPIHRALASGRLLAPLYATLVHHTGRSERSFDDYKGTFAFTFKVKIRRREDAFRYLLRVYDHRAHLDWSFARVPNPSDTFDATRYHEPFAEELTTAELDAIALQVERLAFESTRGAPAWIEEFAKAVDAEQLIYGFDPGTRTFYAKRVENEDEYEADKKRIRARFPRRAELQAIIDEGW